MSKNGPHRFDVEELRKLIAGIDLGDAKMNEYVSARWLRYVQWWDMRARNSKIRYECLRVLTVVGGAMIPALVALRELKLLHELDHVFAIAAIVVSLLVAICTGLDGVFRWGEIWREKRVATELLTSEGFSFLQQTGTYLGLPHQKAFPLFAQNVEELIRREIKDYVVATAPQQQKQEPQ